MPEPTPADRLREVIERAREQAPDLPPEPEPEKPYPPALPRNWQDTDDKETK